MAGPTPPPPPPPPMGGPKLDLPLGPPAKMPAGRDALLGDIHKGMKLKKTVTVDKSKPLLDVKPSPMGAAGPSKPSILSLSSNNAGSSMPVGPQLGDIFAGGMPKLKSVKDNRSGIVPPSAPKIPIGQPVPSISTTVPSTPTHRPATKTSVPSVSAQRVPGTAPPPLPGSVPPPLPPNLPPSSASSNLKVPKLPPTRPKKLSHLRTSSVSSVHSFESQTSLSKVPTLPPPPPALVPPPLPLAPPPVPMSLADKGTSNQTLASPPPPPPPPGGLPFLAEINSRRSRTNEVELTTNTEESAALVNVPVFNAAPKPTGSVPPTPPPPPPPPPPPAPAPALALALAKIDIKPVSQPPSVPEAPPPPPATPYIAQGSDSTPKSMTGGTLPFLEQINAKRNEAYVIDESVSQAPQKPPSRSDSTNISAPAPEDHPNIPLVPALPRQLPPKRDATSVTPAPPAPPAPPAIEGQSRASQNTKFVPGDGSIGVGDQLEPSFISPPVLSAPPPPPSAPPSAPHQLSQAIPKKKPAPPPPPSTLDQQQSVGLNLRKISALAYTINTLQRKKTNEATKIMIEDKRFRFVNSNALPNPRRFEGKEKLYPSGRGSSLPLDLSSFQQSS